MLKIKNLKATISNHQVLKGIDLEIHKGETHVIMGPNGSGKSSLASILAGHPKYNISEGSITFLNQDINCLSPEERANKGIFLGFQYPVEIPGINNSYFIKTALNSQRQYSRLDPLNASQFIKEVNKTVENLQIDKKLLKRNVNEGFSGGEKKRNEILQMAIMKPKLAILDEIDSGLDIDALENVGKSINKLKNEENSILIITHYPRILKYIKPDFVHILIDGTIEKSGKLDLVQKIEEEGYEWIKQS